MKDQVVVVIFSVTQKTFLCVFLIIRTRLQPLRHIPRLFVKRMKALHHSILKGTFSLFSFHVGKNSLHFPVVPFHLLQKGLCRFMFTRVLLQQAVDNAEIKEIPEELVTEYSAQYTSYYQQYASYFGMEFSDFLTQYMNQTEDDFNKDAADYGKQVAGNMLVVCAIAKAEKIDPDALYDEKVAQYAKQSGYSDVATLEKDYSQKYLRQVIINEEVLNVLEENAVAVAPTETESEASK